MKFNIKNLILGRALKNEELSHEKLPRLWGLPIMASDAVSSVAYAIEEMLWVLIPLAGLTAFKSIPFIVSAILILLVILILSYSKIIDHYPNGGGAYAVAKENIGSKASLLVASALVIDYIMTVAVSISSSTAALASAFPVLENNKVLVSLVCVGLISLINLRGIKEASKVFGLPTYIFIVSMALLIIVGFVELLTDNLKPIQYSGSQLEILPKETITGIGLLVIFKAFSSGCSAMTGVEAVSNAVPSFKEPSSRNAKHILFMLGGIIIFIFGGTAILAQYLKVIPQSNVTVLSQMASAVFGNSFIYYIIQIFTSLILILAANTAYNGLPQLLYILAHDGFVPRYFSNRGAKLNFSNGIIFIFMLSSLLIIGFKSDTHRLIPLYSVGVFVSFTFAQYGMFKKWKATKEKGWQYKRLINGFGALVTVAVAVIVFYNKFMEGAWVLAIVFPIIMLVMYMINRHYNSVTNDLKLDEFNPYYKKEIKRTTQSIILVHDINKPFLKALNYATSVSENITALHICRHPEHAKQLRQEWEKFGIPYHLEIIETPYRDIIEPMNEYLHEREKLLDHGESISVIFSKLVFTHWYDYILHNNTTISLTQNLYKHKNISAVVLPFHTK